MILILLIFKIEVLIVLILNNTCDVVNFDQRLARSIQNDE